MHKEERQAAAVRQLDAHGKRLLEAKLVVEDEWRRLKPVAQEALRAGVPTRRVRQLTGVSLATINRWSHEESSD